MNRFPIQAIKNDVYNACAFLCKAAVFITAPSIAQAVLTTAVGAAGVALHHFLRSPEPTWSNFFESLETGSYIDYRQRDCLEVQQKAIGLGSSEECMAALANYHPSQAYTLDLVTAMGGAEAFCKLPVIQLEERLVPGEPISHSIVGTILKHGSARGLDQTSRNLFAGVATSVTKIVTHPDWPEENLEIFNDYNEPEATIYFHACSHTQRVWQTASCKGRQWHCSAKNLEDSTFEDLGRLVKGETVCESDISAGLSRNTCRTLL